MEKVLNQLELGPKEQKLYKLILERGKVSAAQLSRIADINRTTVYSVARELLSKGLIVEDLGGKVLYYSPARETELEKILKNEKEKLAQKESAVHELQEFLKNHPRSQTYSVPKIRFIEGSDLPRYFKEVFPRWVSSAKQANQGWWGFQDDTFIKEFEDIIDWSWGHIPESISFNLFTNKSDIEEFMQTKKYSHRRHLKFWNTGQFSASQWIAGDYVCFCVTKQKPHYLVEIHDSVMAHNMREVFRELWNKS